mmetsp:Transcript_9701/g.36030  ORF Transcript_9701/g.36030 Transcript_9701/m.36030 type:complete len:200 (+) Transcript_9701:1773-2372(+)
MKWRMRLTPYMIWYWIGLLKEGWKKGRIETEGENFSHVVPQWKLMLFQDTRELGSSLDSCVVRQTSCPSSQLSWRSFSSLLIQAITPQTTPRKALDFYWIIFCAKALVGWRAPTLQDISSLKWQTLFPEHRFQEQIQYLLFPSNFSECSNTSPAPSMLFEENACSSGQFHPEQFAWAFFEHPADFLVRAEFPCAVPAIS